jgi:hypothetical protein
MQEEIYNLERCFDPLTRTFPLIGAGHKRPESSFASKRGLNYGLAEFANWLMACFDIAEDLFRLLLLGTTEKS